MHEISDFGHLVLDNIPKKFVHIIIDWIEKNLEKVVETREEWKKEQEKKDANEGTNKNNNEDQP